MTSIIRSLLATFLLSSCAQAGQPTAPAPIAAPLRELPWGQLNFLHTTDTHGWEAGHLQEAQYGADFGDYVSFVQHMRARADKDSVDLLVVDTGDRVDGNGLYDGSKPKGKYTLDIFDSLDADIVTIGNHELYENQTIIREFTEVVPRFKDSYIASNVDLLHPETGKRVPLAQRFRRFKTKNQGLRVLAFGFIYDFTINSKNSFVTRVEDTVKEKWFTEAILADDIDVIIVAGHVMIKAAEYAVVLSAIRSVRPDMPIYFFGGHLHIRDALRFDDFAQGLASGRFMETVGFASMSGLSTASKHTKEIAFGRRYIDGNLFSYYHHSGRNESNFLTKEGKAVSNRIASARKTLALDGRYGCAPKDLWVNRASYPSNDSLLSWLVDDVLPTTVINDNRKDKPRLVIVNSGGIRFDIFRGPFTYDSVYIVCPFGSKFVHIPDVPYSAAKAVSDLLNSGPTPFDTIGLELGISMQRSGKLLKQQEMSRPTQRGDQVVLADEPTLPLIPGYTTIDDFGTTGDDTVHAPIKFYPTPNVIQASIGVTAEKEPDKVDIVFFDFIQAYVVLALKALGQNYTVGDVKPYLDRTLGSLMAEYATKNWETDC